MVAFAGRASADGNQGWINTHPAYSLERSTIRTVQAERLPDGACYYFSELRLTQPGTALAERAISVNLSTCQVKLERGVPPNWIIQRADAEVLGQTTSVPSPPGYTEESGTPATNTDPVYTSAVISHAAGYHKTYVELDSNTWDQNSVTDRVDWYFDGSCTTNYSSSYHRGWMDGWTKQVDDDDPRWGRTCSYAYQNSLVQFYKHYYCSVFKSDVTARYDRNYVRGWYDGELTGGVGMILGGECASLYHYEHFTRYTL
jgi:hypothetical protein